MTAIEVSAGRIRLIHWPDSDKKPRGEEIQSDQLSALFQKLEGSGIE